MDAVLTGGTITMPDQKDVDRAHHDADVAAAHAADVEVAAKQGSADEAKTKAKAAHEKAG